jgi:hypothetical protein
MASLAMGDAWKKQAGDCNITDFSDIFIIAEDLRRKAANA